MEEPGKKKSDKKGNLLNDSIYRKCPEQVSPQR
jgi:hypothetical protein